jgi:hypothetical protein
MDELPGRLRHEMEDEHAPADSRERIFERIRRREHARRLRAGGLGLALTGLIIAAFAAVGGPRGVVPVTPGSPSDATTSIEPLSPPGTPLPGSPPPVTVRFVNGSVALQPYSFCYRSQCVDGGPSRMPHVGAPDVVTVEFPLDGWFFTAFFSPSGVDCGRIQSAPVSPNDDGTFTLAPVGFAGDYDVSLFGEAPRGGDLSVAFRWTTPADGPLPKPRAYLALLANDDPVTSYGVELHVSNLVSTPSSARARITVRASNGREITFQAEPAERDCLPEGTVYWDGPDAKGLMAATLGDPPFTYEVELVLDGERYAATAVWPDDEIKGEEPAVLLDFVPALPAL